MARGYKVAALAVIALAALQSSALGQSLAFSLFERYLEPLRVQAGIPGMSAAIVQDGQIVWEAGFGLADVESNTRARPDTPYNVADLTETFTTLMLAQCAERGLVQADDPIRKWVPQAADPPATLRQLLSHTSGATKVFRHDPTRFVLLTHVVESCAGISYKQALAQSILDRTAMTDASPGREFTPVVPDGNDPPFEAISFDKYAGVLRRLATPYKFDKQRGRTIRSELPAPSIDAATGLIASVRDLAKYDGALDIIVRPDTLAETWTNVVVNGTAQPTTMGWFGQTYEGQRLIWQFGILPDAYSSLILKIPARRLTLILLANSDGLTAPFPLQDGDVTASLFARTFLRLFF
jgi:CubicO group peptidase (beta-lactamase class C family)